MIITWFSIIGAIGAVLFLVTLVALAGTYLYRNRPQPDNNAYFWDDR